MAKEVLVITNNSGGQSNSDKEGQDKTFAYSRHIDFRKNPNIMSILPRTTRESGTVVTGLITDMIQLPSGKMVAIDNSGGVYERSTAGTWTKNGTSLPDTAFGMVYNLQQDTIWITGQTTLHSITNADGRFGGSFTVNSYAVFQSLDTSETNLVSTYTTTGSITETDANKLSYAPSREPLYSIKLWVVTKGSVSITVTMHDAANNTLGTVTKLVADITDGALNEFIFTSVRMAIGASYHFHVTHTSGTASTIGTGILNDFSSSRYETYPARLVDSVNNFHPIYEFLQYYIILNERYVAAWEPISQSAPSAVEFQQHRLTFPSGYEGTSGAVYNEYFAIGAEKRSTLATNEFQAGKIFFWDGLSTTYNFVIDIPEGAPYGLYVHRNVLYYFAGGSWYAWAGSSPIKIFQMPLTDTEYTDTDIYTVNYPHTMAVRNSILMAAFPSETSSTSTEHGVYSFGARSRGYPDALGYSYTISTGTRTNGTVRIGAVKNFGDKLFVAWRDDSNYAVDKVDPYSDPFPTATWESLIIDNERAYKTKKAIKMVVTYKALPAGCTVTPKYKIDRGSWVTGTAGTAGSTEIALPINNRYKEIQLGLDLVAITTTPEIISVSITYDNLESERD